MLGTASKKYRPLQLYQLAQDGMSCELLSPAPGLEHNIYYYWILRIEKETISLPVIPDGATDLVMSPGIAHFSMLYFPQVEKFSIQLEGPVTYVGICMRTEQLREIFSADISQLRELESGASTTRFLKLEQTVAELQDCTETETIRRLLDRSFTNILAETVAETPTHSLSMFLNHVEPATVRAMAAHVNLSERQFRRISERMLGLSPKKLQRVCRLQNILATLLSSDMRLVAEGFYDDSHMIKELKQLTGLTPGEIRKMAENYNQSE